MRSIKSFSKMLALAIIIALVLTNIAIAGHVLFNGVSDTWYVETGNAVSTGHIGPSSYDDNFTFTPFSMSIYDSEFSQLSFTRIINKPNEWTSSYSFGQTTQWQGEEKYTELIDIYYSNWSGDIDSGFGFAITTENNLTIWITWYDDEGNFDWSVWNHINGWHKPELRG